MGSLLGMSMLAVTATMYFQHESPCPGRQLPSPPPPGWGRGAVVRQQEVEEELVGFATLQKHENP